MLYKYLRFSDILVKYITNLCSKMYLIISFVRKYNIK